MSGWGKAAVVVVGVWAMVTLALSGWSSVRAIGRAETYGEVCRVSARGWRVRGVCFGVFVVVVLIAR